MTAGRKKKCRNISIDFNSMICHCFGPLKLPKKQLEQLEQVYLGADELQAFVYQDLDGFVMEKGAKAMGISKTVYVGIYQSAKKKIADSILHNKILMLECNDK